MGDQRNVILVTVDSLRLDYCSYADELSDAMPTLERLADDGLAFENAIATGPATHESATTFMTGEHAVERPGSTEITKSQMRTHIRAHLRSQRTLAERMSAAGYETAGFTANPWTSRHFGFDAGFDYFEDFMDEDLSQGLIEGGRPDNTVRYALVQALNWWQGQDMFMSWENYYDEIATWLESADDPYFAWAFLVDPHLPYIPGDEYRSRSRLMTYLANMWMYAGRPDWFDERFRAALLDAYEDTVRHTDAFLSRLLDDLEEMDDDPLLIVHADHGELFGEHGRYGHGGYPHEELAHVPLVVGNGPNDTVTEPFSLRRLPELVSTLAAGGDYEALTEPWVVTRNRNPTTCIRGKNWKFGRRHDGEELLHALPGDENEQLDNEELRAIGRQLVDDWEEAKRERERIVRGVDELPIGSKV
ncbi:sulfatase-like hydrolase/transferase [Natronosalvus halobius]|uniref:sulfatase-like hydrolase/transferase n=1 Tax=Natronosalvus halobius TaxID=2953746 RepID=UPI0020A16781|nr:sulfatase-like hydrolase/transferase [Natronosalvus halobius]USZ70719.1 sulfatase-like hydrolase/transferase [Natronosalvus halobius]